MGAPQRFATRRLQAEAVLEAVLADPPADLSQGDPVAGWWAYDLEHEAIFRKVGKHAAGRRLDGRTWDELPISTPERQP